MLIPIEQRFVQIMARQSTELAASIEVHGGTLQLLEVVKAHVTTLGAQDGQVSAVFVLHCSSPCSTFLQPVPVSLASACTPLQSPSSASRWACT